MQSLRLFVGAMLPPDIQKYLINSFFGLPIRLEALRPVSEENLHLTFKFIGAVALDRLPEIIAAIEESVQEQAIFDLETSNGILLPDHHPRAVGMGIKPTKALTGLVESIDESLARNGLSQREFRQYRPHLTLGRIVQGGELPDDDRVSIRNWHIDRSWPVASVELISSELSRQGPTYTVMQSFELES